MNINEAKKLLEQERQLLQHEIAALKRRIGAALLRKRLGHPGESVNGLRTELSANEARLRDLTLMLEAVPDVEAYLTDHYEHKHDVPIANNMDQLRADYLEAKKKFKDGFRAMRDDQPRLMSAAMQVLAKARAARQTNDAKSFLNEYIRHKPIIGRAFEART